MSIKDLVLINSPMQKYSEENRPHYFTTAPLGLGYLATIASNAGYDVELVDAEAEKLSPREIIERVNKYESKMVGSNLFSTNHKLALDIMKEINSDYKIVGGPYVTLGGRGIPIEYGAIKGEAENIFLDVLKNNSEGFVDAGLVGNLDSLPFIDRKFFINDPYFLDERKEVSISSSRGCSFSCAYCSVPTISGKQMRFRSVENVVSEIEKLAEEGVNSIHFVDDLFNFSKERTRSFAKAISESSANPNWRALCRIENLDKELLTQMRDSGCYKIALGIESATPRILKYIGKNSDTKKVESVFNYCKELGIQTKAFFTIGYPTETKKEIESTIDFAMKLNPDSARFMVVRAFPQTRLYEDVKSSGIPVDSLDGYVQSNTNQSYVKYHVMNLQSLNGMSAKELDKYITKAYHRFSKLKDWKK
ncbi:radical SAM protein [Candidatus Pacearchaeota archaeon]|nr:radical SAM protein [Candidatus Pacearchaeota archaeon]